MDKRYIFWVLLGFIAACSPEPQLPNTPETVTRQWLQWNDQNNFQNLEEISSGSTLEFIKYIEKSTEGLTDEMETTSTIVQRIQCSKPVSDASECVYCCNDGEEEKFILKKEKGQWRVDEIVTEDNPINEDEMMQEKMLEDLLKKEK